MKRSIFLLGIFCILSFCNVYGQEYDHSAGFRLGGTSGITYKKFLVEEQAIEFLISGRNKGVQLTGMYIYHQPMAVSFNENFYFYYGVGGHVGAEEFGDIDKRVISQDQDVFVYERQQYLTMGIDAIAGIEYRMFSVPITLSFDIKPYFNYVGLRNLKADFWDSSITIKYIF